MKIVAFVPLKLNNERLPGKNLKPFLDGQSPLSLTLAMLQRVHLVDEVYVFCSSGSLRDQIPDSIRFIQRSAELDSATTTGNDLVQAFAQVVEADIYVKMHVTAPFIEPASIERGINALLNEGYDSAFPVTTQHEFLWIGGKPNYNTKHIPRTQDLMPFHIETTGFYVYKKEVLCRCDSRIGTKPFLIPVSKIEATDINDPIDFDIASAIYSQVILKR
ncbi:MAG: acylneuraminate cytidylyltransferase family protein [Oscillospiraceae bacterium]|nr:acylneuraminate cytidylyltransferase family protein [Oscillospiraceae bacterium]